MQLAMQISTKIVSDIRIQMTALRSLPLMVLLSLFLLFAQAVEYGHSHEVDLQAQFDCEICLKMSSLEDIAVAEAPNLGVPSTHYTFSILIQNQISSELVSASARGPPSYA